MAISKAQQKATLKYVKNNYDRIEIKVIKGKKQIISNLAEKQELSLNAYIKGAIKQRIKADTGQDVEL